MAEKQDGGQAFPKGSYGYDGMSLRDYFAGQALIASQDSLEGCSQPRDWDRLATRCYRMADAMLFSRGATQ